VGGPCTRENSAHLALPGALTRAAERWAYAARAGALPDANRPEGSGAGPAQGNFPDTDPLAEYRAQASANEARVLALEQAAEGWPVVAAGDVQVGDRGRAGD